MDPARRSAPRLGVAAALGLAFGFCLAMAGFGDYAEVHAMFTFQDLRLLFTFAGAVVLAAVVYFGVQRQRPVRGHVRAGVVPGAVLFGTGWALCGGCPSIPVIQLGAGYLPAAATLLGIVCGMRVFGKVNARWLRIDPGSCGA